MQNVLTGFLIRWGTEVGGIATVLIGLYVAASPADQQAIQAILTGQGGGLTLNTYIGLAVYAWGRWLAYRATTVPQVVTSAGEKILPKPDSVAMERVETQAKAAPKRETLWERLLQR